LFVLASSSIVAFDSFLCVLLVVICRSPFFDFFVVIVFRILGSYSTAFFGIVRYSIVGLTTFRIIISTTSTTTIHVVALDWQHFR
jgi:hypothetical protein